MLNYFEGNAKKTTETMPVLWLHTIALASCFLFTILSKIYQSFDLILIVLWT